MSNVSVEQIADLINARLGVLAHIVERAAKEAPSADALLASRVAPDMHPFPTQIAFVCNQALGFAHLCGGAEPEQPTDSASLSVDQLKAMIGNAQTAVKAAGARADDAVLRAEKRVALPGERHIMFTGQSYVDDWILPNLYFHMSIAYALARGLDVGLGKIDWMAHLAPSVRPN